MKTKDERRAAFIHAFNKAKHPASTQDEVNQAFDLFVAEGPAAWAENVDVGDRVEAALRTMESPNWSDFFTPTKEAAQKTLRKYLNREPEKGDQ